MNCTPDLIERMNFIHPKIMSKHEELEEFLEILKIRIEVEEAYSKGMDLIANKINKYQEKYQEELAEIFQSFCSFFAIQNQLRQTLINNMKSDVNKYIETFLKMSKEAISSQINYAKDTEKCYNKLKNDFDKIKYRFIKSTYMQRNAYAEGQKFQKVENKSYYAKNIENKMEYSKIQKVFCEKKLKTIVEEMNIFTDNYFLNTVQLGEFYCENLNYQTQLFKDCIMKSVVYETSLATSLLNDLSKIGKKLGSIEFKKIEPILFQECPNEKKPLLKKLNFENLKEFLENNAANNSRREEKDFMEEEPEIEEKKEDKQKKLEIFNKGWLSLKKLVFKKNSSNIEGIEIFKDSTFEKIEDRIKFLEILEKTTKVENQLCEQIIQNFVKQIWKINDFDTITKFINFSKNIQSFSSQNDNDKMFALIHDWENFNSQEKWFDLINSEIKKLSDEGQKINFKKQSEFNILLIGILQRIKELGFHKIVIANFINKMKELYEMDEIVCTDLIAFLNA